MIPANWWQQERPAASSLHSRCTCRASYSRLGRGRYLGREVTRTFRAALNGTTLARFLGTAHYWFAQRWDRLVPVEFIV
eukprot:425811-Pleurochrysis_carterae.AAC.1